MKEIIIKNVKAYIERNKFEEAVLICGGKITAAAAEKEILFKAKPGAEIIDGKGRLLLPGFNDSHLHLYALGRNRHRIKANGVKSIDELVERGKKLIEELKYPEGSVVSGTGWNQELFTGSKRIPDRRDLDRISTKHAVIINRICGHSLSCNTLAMEMAGITRSIKASAGEQIEFDGDGYPLGIFGEGPAMNKLRALIPPFTDEQMEEQLVYAMETAIENGITSLGTRDVVEENYSSMIGAYLKMFTKHDLKIRVNLQCTMEKDEIFNEFVKRGWTTGASLGHPYLTMGASKLFADGSLGARTAFLKKPYNDAPQTCGYQIHSQEEMDALVKKHSDSGFQVIIHAIGDAAIEETINSFEKVIPGGKNELRHGIVHCQITGIPLLERIAKNNILAFVQPVFLLSDIYMIENRVGNDLASTSYAFAAMKKMGISTPYGTDCPIESINPLECIDCAVNRRNIENNYPENGFYPGECVDVFTAVDAYTHESAYSEFMESKKGRIKKDFLADLILLDKDIFSIDKKEIHTAKVLRTITGGKTAFLAD